VLYEVLALALRSPTAEGLCRLRGRGAARTLIDAAGVIGKDGQVEDAASAFLAAARGAARGDLERSYQRLFGHTARGKVPPYETEYGGEEVFRQSQELGDIGGFYRAFGLTVAPGEHERSDHLGAECEFLSFLARKEAREIARGEAAAGEEVRRAARLFLRDHAGHFGRAVGRALAREADQPFYRALGELCFAVLTADCEHFGLPPGPEFLKLRADTEDEVPMACGGCALAQLGGREGAE
jgi:TorA maturation chaperone TorD